MNVETTNRVQVAAHHWRPRFVANGIDVNDFDDTVAKTTEWKDWGPNWLAVGEMHEALGREAEQHGRTLSATQAYQRAAWWRPAGPVGRDLSQDAPEPGPAGRAARDSLRGPGHSRAPAAPCRE